MLFVRRRIRSTDTGDLRKVEGIGFGDFVCKSSSLFIYTIGVSVKDLVYDDMDVSLSFPMNSAYV